MARNQEKSQSMLNRYISSEKPEGRRRRRPYLASECRDFLKQTNGGTKSCVKLADLYSRSKTEDSLRDLNDEINKLIREKSHWEKRIIELGGPNYMVYSAKMTDLEGNIVDVPNSGGGRGPGYRYFGAAKKLPGVRELFEKPPESRKRRRRRTIHEIYKRVDAGYYGYTDDGDGILEKLEEQKNLFEDLIDHEEREDEFLVHVPLPDEKEIQRMVVQRKRIDHEDEEREEEFLIYVPLPDEKEIERTVVQQKKMKLLKKYVSEELMEEEREARAMLNIHR